MPADPIGVMSQMSTARADRTGATPQDAGTRGTEYSSGLRPAGCDAASDQDLSQRDVLDALVEELAAALVADYLADLQHEASDEGA